MTDDVHLVAPSSAAEQLQWLVDRALIVDTVYLYATAVDSRDWNLYRSIFTDVIDVDFSSFFQGGKPGWVNMSVDAWVDSARAAIAPLEATQHSLYNPRVTIDGDQATCVISMQAEHFRADRAGANSYTVGGYYSDRLVRTAAGWRLNQVKLTVRWERGNKQIMVG